MVRVGEWPPLHTLVLLAITTGARKGELIRLKWSDIDLRNGRALVRETKNDEQRTLPLAGKALEALRALKLQNSARSEWVFAQPSRLPGPYEHFDAHWYAALEAAGITDFDPKRSLDVLLSTLTPLLCVQLHGARQILSEALFEAIVSSHEVRMLPVQIRKPTIGLR
jgi:integrase